MIKITVDASKAIAGLRDIQRRQIPFAAARALTKTANKVAAAEKQEIQRVFDRPTPYTVNSIFVTPATKENPTAVVGVKDSAAKGAAAAVYLGPEVFGGTRTMKRSEALLRRSGVLGASEYLIPSKRIPLDGYGNVPKGVMQAILSGISAYAASGFNQNRNRNKARASTSNYFVVSRQRGQPRIHAKPLPNGIYRRDGRTITPLLFFSRAPFYKQRFDFFGVAEKTALAEFPLQFSESLDLALRTAR